MQETKEIVIENQKMQKNLAARIKNKNILLSLLKSSY